MKQPQLPIAKIDEENWIEKLVDFLEEYDVDPVSEEIEAINPQLP